MLVTRRQKRIDDKLSININSKPISQVKSAKTLGLHTEETLSWSKHLEHIYKKVGPLLGRLKKIRNYVDQDTLIKSPSLISSRILSMVVLFGIGCIRALY